jgi:hypothetical protein
MHLSSDHGSESSNVCVRVGIGKSKFLQKPDEHVCQSLRVSVSVSARVCVSSEYGIQERVFVSC